jgi:DNA-binding CsgD family transcriptional regulator
MWDTCVAERESTMPRTTRQFRLAPHSAPDTENSEAEHDPGAVGHAPAAQSIAASSPSRPAPFVGRALELHRLGAALARAAAGRGGALFLTGEPGVGKTRLAQEAVAVARTQSFLVLEGRAHALETTLAYAPILEAFGAYLRALDGQRRAALVSDLPDLGRLFGDLQLPPPEPLGDPALEKTRLFDAVARLLARLAGEAPVLLFLDDLHWADHTSLELVHYIARGLAAQRALLLATCREADVESTHGFLALLRSLRRLRLLDEVTLPSLAPDAVAALVCGVLGGEASPELLAVIQRRSGGIPLFVEMLLVALIDTGQLLRTDDGWALPAGATLDVPPLIQDIIVERLARLERAGRQILELLAVSGEATPHGVLRDASGLDDAAFLGALHHLRSAALLVEASRGAEVVYALSHPLIGEVAYAELPEIMRRRMHLALATALDRVQPDDVNRLARHYRGAGSEADQQRALELLLAAGERARMLYANEEASQHFAAALELVRQGGRGELLPLVLEWLGEAWERLGEGAAASSVWSEALAAYQRAGDALAVARLHRLLALTEADRGGVEAAQMHLQAGVSALARHQPSPELADLHLARVVILIRRGAIEEATVAAAELLALAARLRSPRMIGQAQLASLRAHVGSGEFAAAREAGVQALAAAEAGDDLLLAQAVHDQLFVLAWVLGEHRVARDHAAHSLELAQQLGAPTLEVIARARLALADFVTGAWDETLRQGAEVLVRARRIGQPRTLAMILLVQGFLLAGRGDLAGAEANLAEARGSVGTGAHASYHPFMADTLEAILALEQGDAGRIRAAAARLAAQPALRSFPYGLAILGEARVASGEIEQALEAARELGALGAAGGAYLTALAARVEGLARKARGEKEEARACLARAVEGFAACDLPFEAARTRLEWVGLADSQRDAVASAEASLAVFERLRARRYADRTRRVLRRLGVRPQPVRRPGPGGGPLSRRELEVARLIADGLTTAQIAERLVISPYTAATHLHRIYERLGINSRAALTRYMAEAGLL